MKNKEEIIEVIIKNNYSHEWNFDLIKSSLEKIKIDLYDVKKIFITNRIINFVTK